MSNVPASEPLPPRKHRQLPSWWSSPDITQTKSYSSQSALRNSSISLTAGHDSDHLHSASKHSSRNRNHVTFRISRQPGQDTDVSGHIAAQGEVSAGHWRFARPYRSRTKFSTLTHLPQVQVALARHTPRASQNMGTPSSNPSPLQGAI